MRTIYDKYAKLLEKKGVTTYQVCKATGIPESTISMMKARYENGDDPGMSIGNLAKLSKYFRVPLEYFVEDKENK